MDPPCESSAAAGASDDSDLRLRKVDIRLPGKGNPNSHGARQVHLIITMIKWIRTSRLSIKNSLSVGGGTTQGCGRRETRKRGATAPSTLPGSASQASFIY